ncbi:MAG: AAA family ATPase [Prevotella sp.]|nr:AAA family ATPase [Prevotella sp.]
MRFVLLTGITKFSQVSMFSGVNQPDDISIDARFEALCGITEAELYTVFAEPIAELAKSWGCGVDAMKTELVHLRHALVPHAPALEVQRGRDAVHRTLLRPQNFYRLQGRHGDAPAHDLPERLLHHQGREPPLQHLPA